MLDANHGFDAIEAIELGRRVAPLRHRLVRGAGGADDLGSYVEVRRGQPIPVAGGECEFTRWGFREVLARRAIDILQPDICAAGGLSEGKKIADMAAAFGVRCVPHVWGTAWASPRRCSCWPCCRTTRRATRPLEPLLEFDRSEHPFRQAVLTAPIEHAGGVVRLPEVRASASRWIATRSPDLRLPIEQPALKRNRGAPSAYFRRWSCPRCACSICSLEITGGLRSTGRLGGSCRLSGRTRADRWRGKSCRWPCRPSSRASCGRASSGAPS